MMKLKIDQPAPDFSLKDQNGDFHRLSDYKGKWVLVYFYPKDNTPGCIKEACVIRDNFPAFEKLNIAILGISNDTVESHKKFAQKYKLPFTLLADDKKEVVKKYSVWGKKKFMGIEYEGISRTSFLINPQGKIVKIYENVKPAIHAKEVLDDLNLLINK
ncbi:MAG: peroxiredoxin [Candidatus Parcubacteria bacterium]|nr:MAG: peroxiredoxin [Candidatus Parcubacteria bacterium]